MADQGDGTNAAQIAYWNDAAGPNWVAMQEHLDRVFTPLTTVALNAAAPTDGETVIDTGCGCGATTLELARRVGPSGHVLGLDVSQPMADRARQRITAAGLTNADILVADASTATLPSADLLFSRFGVMFFVDPVAAFANLRRAMRPGGRMVCAVWRPVADNAWFGLPIKAARDLLPPQPPADPHAPGPFAFADADRVIGILSQAGWRNAAMVRQDVPMPIAGPGQIDKAATDLMRVGPLARQLAEADPAMLARVHAAIAEALQPHDSLDGIVLGGSIWLLLAQS